MSKFELKDLAEFEWASVAQYIVYISSVTQLEEIVSEHVVRFPLAGVGAEKLLLRKQRVLERLKGNKQKILRFAGEFEDELGENELSVLRTLYLQFKRGEEMVGEHLRIIKLYQDEENNSFFGTAEEASDELPF